MLDVINKTQLCQSNGRLLKLLATLMSYKEESMGLSTHFGLQGNVQEIFRISVRSGRLFRPKLGRKNVTEAAVSDVNF